MTAFTCRYCGTEFDDPEAYSDGDTIECADCDVTYTAEESPHDEQQDVRFVLG